MVLHKITSEAIASVAWQVEPEAGAHTVHIVAIPNGIWAAIAQNANIVPSLGATAKNMVLMNSVCVTTLHRNTFCRICRCTHVNCIQCCQNAKCIGQCDAITNRRMW